MHFRLLPLLFLIATFAVAQPTRTKPETVGVSTARLAKLDRVLQEYVSSGKEPGMIAYVARRGQVVYHKAFGYDDVAARTPLRTDAIFRIASQTKALTSLGVMLLYEDGQLLLDEPVSKYIPSFAKQTVLDKFNEKDTTFTTVPAKRAVTLRQLLTHTSGVGYPVIGSREMNAIYAKYKIPSGIGTPDASLADAMNALGKLPLAFQPGERWMYGLNIDVLGRVIEVVSGQPLDQFMQQRIFGPLGMTDTFFYLPDAKHARLAKLYTEDSTGRTIPTPARQQIQAEYPLTKGRFFAGGAGLVSTTADYAKFLQMMANGGQLNGQRLLSPTTVRLMTSNQIGQLSLGANKFGLGFEVTTEQGAAKGGPSAGSFNWGGIFGTTYWVDPKEELVVLLYTQKFPNTTAGDLTDRFKALVYQALTESYAR